MLSKDLSFLKERYICQPMAQYYLKTENNRSILYLSPFSWNDIYKIVAPEEPMSIKTLVAFEKSNDENLDAQEVRGVLYMDERYVHPVFKEMKIGKPISFVRETLERLNLNVYEYDISVNGINVYSYYHDDAIIEIPDGEEIDETIKNIFCCLNLEENLMDELKRNQMKILTIEKGKIIATSEEIEDFFDYLNDQYYVKYPECSVPGRDF